MGGVVGPGCSDRVPDRAADLFVQMRPFGFLILYGLMFTGMLSAMILPPAIFLIGLLVP